MKRKPGHGRLLTLAAATLCTLSVAAPAAAAAGHQATAAQRAGAARISLGSASALAGYFESSGTSSRAYNSTGGTVTAANLTTGEYRVDFAGLSHITGGNAEVTSFSGGATCSVYEWLPNPPYLQVWVTCYTFSGTPVNANFSVIVTQPRTRPHGVLDYDWIQFPARSYTLRGAYQYNSSGGRNTIRHYGAGRYIVTMPGPPPSGTGTVKVSAYNAAAGDCQLDKWSGTRHGIVIYVDCYAASGARQNRQFTVVYARDNNLMGQNGKTDANALADRSSTAIYQPHVQYDSHRGARVTQALLTPGQYVTFFAGSRGPAGDPNGGGGNVQVTPQGGNYTHCVVENQTQEFTPYAFVECENNSGHPVNSKYTVQWVVS
jgi:hypothetical protein